MKSIKGLFKNLTIAFEVSTVNGYNLVPKPPIGIIALEGGFLTGI
jgi:hypothetical protein